MRRQDKLIGIRNDMNQRSKETTLLCPTDLFGCHRPESSQGSGGMSQTGELATAKVSRAVDSFAISVLSEKLPEFYKFRRFRIMENSRSTFLEETRVIDWSSVFGERLQAPRMKFNSMTIAGSLCF